MLLITSKNVSWRLWSWNWLSACCQSLLLKISPTIANWMLLKIFVLNQAIRLLYTFSFYSEIQSPFIHIEVIYILFLFTIKFQYRRSEFIWQLICFFRLLSGDNPDDVKARLKYWAQAVACTVKLCNWWAFAEHVPG